MNPTDRKRLDRELRPTAQASAGNAQELAEVVVTATRRSDTVHNIPLAVTAVSPQEIQQQGVKTAQDLVELVPALRIGPPTSYGGGALNPDVAIRGVRSTVGSATTGIYLDDVPLQQRNLGGAFRLSLSAAQYAHSRRS